MKKTVIITIFLLNVFACFGQKVYYSYKFTYRQYFQLDSTDVNTKHSENMVLLVGKNKSLYISPTKILMDSARIAIIKRGGHYTEILDVKANLPKNRVIYSIKKEKKKITHQYSIPGLKTIETEEGFTNFNWKIKNKYKQILGYKCQLATLNYKGRNYKAWFSTDISIQDGPWKFRNLPGLIFEIKDARNHYAFVLKGIRKETKNFPPATKRNKVIKTTKQNTIKVIKNLMNANANRALGQSKIELKRRIKNFGKKGNPIELKN